MPILSTLNTWLYGISIFVLLIYGINLLVLSLAHAFREREIQLVGSVTNTTGDDPAAASYYPFVTVQLPVYNESHVVCRLIDACASLDYPADRLEIQILDDSTDETSDLVVSARNRWSGSGIKMVHIQRPTRNGYKAGALQHGLESARGELIAIFDADFVPEPDFLSQMVGEFQDKNIGMVQARWAHLNPNHSLLTRLQAFGLDAHFALEQRIRSLTRCFINFNGTAGIWRKACVEDAGGWSLDNLTEDFDLSYRAQLKGWTFKFRSDVDVPAELPVSMNAFRDQQYRWTKGAMQTAAMHLRPLWKSKFPLRVRWEGSLHLTASIVFPFLAIAAFTHPLLIFFQKSGLGPAPVTFRWLSLGLLGFAGFYLAQVMAQRLLYPDWSRRLFIFPLFMAAGIGLSLNNGQAFLSFLARRRSAFVRTPKHDVSDSSQNHAWWRSPYSSVRIPKVAYVEAAVAIYSVAALIYVIAAEAWAAVPFQFVFAVGFLFVSGYNFVQSAQIYRRRMAAP